jgi:tRNA (mo5U34)-methyltransferase
MWLDYAIRSKLGLHSSPSSKKAALNGKGSEDLKEKISALPWYQQIDFGNGLVAPGKVKIEYLNAQADAYFGDGILAGKTFLDIGCWDGYNSFEATRRGAARVLATDHFAWSDECWGNRGSFELGRSHLAPSVEVMDIDVPDLTPERVGKFDVVLFAGVFYHLRNPFLALENLSKLVTNTLILETVLDARHERRPMMVFYPGSELADDPTNWWGPNRSCVLAMLKDVGFSRIKYSRHPCARRREIFHAYRD